MEISNNPNKIHQMGQPSIDQKVQPISEFNIEESQNMDLDIFDEVIPKEKQIENIKFELKTIIKIYERELKEINENIVYITDFQKDIITDIHNIQEIMKKKEIKDQNLEYEDRNEDLNLNINVNKDLNKDYEDPNNEIENIKEIKFKKNYLFVTNNKCKIDLFVNKLYKRKTKWKLLITKDSKQGQNTIYYLILKFDTPVKINLNQTFGINYKDVNHNELWIYEKKQFVKKYEKLED
jgi:hypothetical protein